MRTKFGYAQFISKHSPTYRSKPPAPQPPKPKGWVPGAKFKRPNDHILGGIPLTIDRVLSNSYGEIVFAVEDGLHTAKRDCTLIED